MTLRHTILALAFMLAATPALAGPACVAPRGLQPAPVLTPPADEVQAGVVNAYYLLAITWSPEWCRTNGYGDTSQKLQCEGPPRGFGLHGLWPNGVAKPYPRYCKPVGGLDAVTVRGMFCRTPSPELLQHEWQAHGACGWSDPKAYFADAARLYDRVAPPRIENIPAAALTAGAVRQAFVAKNPWLSREMIFLAVDSRQRLKEIRLCYDLAFQPRACQGGIGTPDAIHIRLTPSANRRF